MVVNQVDSENLYKNKEIAEHIKNNNGFYSVADLLGRRYSPLILNYERYCWESGDKIKTPEMTLDLDKLKEDLNRFRSGEYNDNFDIRNHEHLILDHPLPGHKEKISVTLEKIEDEIYLGTTAHEGEEFIKLRNESKAIEDKYRKSEIFREYGDSETFYIFPIEAPEKDYKSKNKFPEAYKKIFSNCKLRGLDNFFRSFLKTLMGESTLKNESLETKNKRSAVRYPLRIIIDSQSVDKEPKEIRELEEGIDKKENYGHLDRQERIETRQGLEEEWNKIEENFPFIPLGAQEGIQDVLDIVGEFEKKYGNEVMNKLKYLEEWIEGRLNQTQKEKLGESFEESKDFRNLEKYIENVIHGKEKSKT